MTPAEQRAELDAAKNKVKAAIGLMRQAMVALDQAWLNTFELPAVGNAPTKHDQRRIEHIHADAT